MTRWEFTFCVLAAAAGVIILEIATTAFGPPLRIDWDWYKTAGLPLICLLAAGLGYLAPRHPWRWGFLPIVVVPFWILFRGGGGSMWPIFAFSFIACSIPPIITAYVGAWLRRRQAAHRANT